MDINKDKRLIAEFVGFEWKSHSSFPEGGEYWQTTPPFPNGFWQDRDLKFDTSWDWLVPVVDKISGIAHPMAAQTVIAAQANLLNIDIAFRAVVNFVKWYKDFKNT